MKRNLIIPIIAGLLIFAAGITAQAKVSSTTPAKNQLKPVVAQATSTRCQTIDSKIGIKLANFENGQTRRVTAYNNMKSRISNIIIKLDAKGVDTSDLKADAVILDAKIQKLSTDYEAYIASLKGTKDYACGQSQGQFMGKLSEARKLLVQVKKDVLDIRSFYSTTIRPDIIALKDQLKAQKSTSTKSLLKKSGKSATSTLPTSTGAEL